MSKCLASSSSRLSLTCLMWSCKSSTGRSLLGSIHATQWHLFDEAFLAGVWNDQANWTRELKIPQTGWDLQA